ncbi:MAG: beta strand repeat-containing protein, partial [Rickettsiales bacterium]
TNTIKTTGAQDYVGAVTLGSNTILTAPSGVTFGSTVNGPYALTVTGPATFDGAAGGGTALASVSVSGASTFDGSVTTTGTQTYTGAVSLTGNTTINAGNGTTTYGSTIGGAYSLANTGNGLTIFNDITNIAQLSVAGNANLGANITTSGTSTFSGNVNLLNNINIASQGTSRFGAMVDGAYGLSMTGAGNTIFSGLVGSNSPLSSLNITNAASIAGNVTTSGNQTYNGLTLTGNATLNAQNGDIYLKNTTIGANTLGFAGTGNLYVGGAITSTSAMNFTRNVTLTANSSVNSGAANITFNNIDGADNLNLTTTGNVNFLDAVGSAARLLTLTVTGANNVTAPNAVNVTNYSGVSNTGTTNFTDLNATNGISITANSILGTYSGATGNLNSGTGTITATTSFNSLAIAGNGATLSAGYIGAPGMATQNMANLISGVTTPSSKYTFAGFDISHTYLPPVIVPVTIPPLVTRPLVSALIMNAPIVYVNPESSLANTLSIGGSAFSQISAYLTSINPSSHADTSSMANTPAQSGSASLSTSAKNTDKSKDKKKALSNLYGLLKN